MEILYRDLKIELTEDNSSFKVYDKTQVFDIEYVVMEGTSPEKTFTIDRIKDMIDKSLQNKIDSLLEQMDEKAKKSWMN